MNPYTKETIKTKSEVENQSFKSWDELESFSGEKMSDTGQALFFFDHKVIWGKWDGQGFQFNESNQINDVSNLQMMRLFNENRELFLRRIESNKWLCRLREDGIGEEIHVMDAHQFLLGVSQGEGEFSHLWESSGSAKYVPLSVEKDKRAIINTRNYIGYAGGLLANFEDSRILSIEEVS